MTNTNAWLYANSFGQNHFGYANRPIQVNQLCSYAVSLEITIKITLYVNYEKKTDVIFHVIVFFVLPPL